MAFYPKGVTAVGQAKGTLSGFVILRNGWTPPAPPDPEKPHVAFGHIAYTVQFDKPLANGKVTARAEHHPEENVLQSRITLQQVKSLENIAERTGAQAVSLSFG